MRLLLKILGSLYLVVLVSACDGSSPHPAIDDVVTKLSTSGVQIIDVKKPTTKPSLPLPKTYKERVTFSIPEIAPKEGQVFVCDTVKKCDTLYQYLRNLKALDGPFVYKSKDGLVVMVLNGYFPGDIAKKLGDIITGM